MITIQKMPHLAWQSLIRRHLIIINDEIHQIHNTIKKHTSIGSFVSLWVMNVDNFLIADRSIDYLQSIILSALLCTFKYFIKWGSTYKWN